jgi:hypothetical protein
MMGLRSPFDYVGYEYKMAMLFITILDNLCSHCHTNTDYDDGCKGCPAGVSLFAYRDYVLNAQEEDKHHALYASDEWLEKQRARGLSEGLVQTARAKELDFVADYTPECEVLRKMKRCIKEITPHPLFYVQYSKSRPYERPRQLARFTELTREYRRLESDRRMKWGIPFIDGCDL